MTGEDKIKNLTESFTYDNLNRLTGSQVAGQVAINISYENNGNIFSKSDVGEDDYTYKYGENGAGLHAVTSISGITTGTLQLRLRTSILPQQDITYTSFNKIATITQDENEMQFTYGTDNLRRKTQLYNSGNLIKTKYYVGSYEKEITGSNTRELHYIYGGDGLAAVYIKQGTTTNMYYVSKDYLGSPIILTKEDGTIAEQYNFDAWGNRRNPTTWSYTNVPTTYLLDRGFTFHEHMDKFGLINMNGRLYDPEIGRMLSPDKYVQMPDFTQNFNRYSYALNNPLKFTDPTGYTARYLDEHSGIISGRIRGMFFLSTRYERLSGFIAQNASYFSWSNLYNSGLTTTGFSEYLSRGGVCDLNGSGVTTYVPIYGESYAGIDGYEAFKGYYFKGFKEVGVGEDGGGAFFESGNTDINGQWLRFGVDLLDMNNKVVSQKFDPGEWVKFGVHLNEPYYSDWGVLGRIGQDDIPYFAFYLSARFEPSGTDIWRGSKNPESGRLYFRYYYSNNGVDPVLNNPIYMSIPNNKPNMPYNLTWNNFWEGP